MAAGGQQGLVRDACLTVGNIIERELPGYVEGRPVTVVFDPPTDEQLEEAYKEGGIVVSVVWLDSSLSKAFQSTAMPIVHEEDEDGNICEFRTGAPQYVRSRFMITAWTKSSLDAQVATGSIMAHFLSFPNIEEEYIKGDSIRIQDTPSLDLEDVDMDGQMRLWELWNAGDSRTYRPSLVVITTLRMDSMKRKMVRRVREKINVFRKVEG
ncbi:Pvc16 family protein [Planctomycetota bacterium]